MTQPSLHQSYTIWWLVWFVMFVAVEGAALYSNEPGRTLTEHIRWLMADHPLWAIAVFGLLCWLFAHFMIQTYQ